MSHDRNAGAGTWGDIAPKLGETSDRVLFDDGWQRADLSPRDRSLVTVSSLMALFRANDPPFDLGKALYNGVTRAEVIETITHAA